jgi:hypothetical protein
MSAWTKPTGRFLRNFSQQIFRVRRCDKELTHGSRPRHGKEALRLAQNIRNSGLGRHTLIMVKAMTLRLFNNSTTRL